MTYIARFGSLDSSRPRPVKEKRTAAQGLLLLAGLATTDINEEVLRLAATGSGIPPEVGI